MSFIRINKGQIWQDSVEENGWSIVEDGKGAFDIYIGEVFTMRVHEFFEAIEYVKDIK